MSKLNVDQKSITSLFQEKGADFVVPEFQRPYAWGEEECQSLWSDILEFAFPGNDYSKFDSNSEYYLGSIVIYKNEETGKKEIIDGQQRLTTLMLLLRAFCSKFKNMQDEKSVATKENIERCLYKTDEFGKPDMNLLKIDSNVITDNDREEFLNILRTGKYKTDDKSRYVENYKFFETKINEFLEGAASYFAYLPTRILNNCIILPVESESKDVAFRIFFTLNNRGKSLSDSDIFKTELYKFYSEQGKVSEFNDEWKELEGVCLQAFKRADNPMVELFTRYMYYERAKQGKKDTTTDSLRSFYENNNSSILRSYETFDNLKSLALFWKDVEEQDNNRFSDRVLKKLFVLNFAPNGMWAYFVSVYFLKNKNETEALDDENFYNFLNKIIAFIWMYAFVRPGVNALRTPVYPEMINIMQEKKVEFTSFKFERKIVERKIDEYSFTNSRQMTRSMLAWWTFENKSQSLLKNDMSFQLEHIFSVNRQKNDKTLSDNNLLESLGNKIFLERKINIRASDYRFEDKKNYYLGRHAKNDVCTEIKELKDIAETKKDFIENDIKEREKKIVDSFIAYLKNANLLE